MNRISLDLQFDTPIYLEPKQHALCKLKLFFFEFSLEIRLQFRPSR